MKHPLDLVTKPDLTVKCLRFLFSTLRAHDLFLSPLSFFVSVCVFVCKCYVCFEGFMVTLTKSMIFMRSSETREMSKSNQISSRKLRIFCCENLKIIRTQTWHETWGNGLIFFINHLSVKKRRRKRKTFPYKAVEKLENKLKRQHWKIKHNHELIHKPVTSRSQIKKK